MITAPRRIKERVFGNTVYGSLTASRCGLTS